MSAAIVSTVVAKAPRVGGFSYRTTQPMTRNSAIGVTRVAGAVSALFVMTAFPRRSLPAGLGENGLESSVLGIADVR